MKKDNTSKLYIYDSRSNIVHLSSASGLKEQVDHIDAFMNRYKLFTPMYQGLYLVAANNENVSIVINTSEAEIHNNNDSILGICKEIYRTCIFVPSKDAGERYIKFKSKNGYPFFIGMETETTLQYFGAGGGEPVTKEMISESTIVRTDVKYTEAIVDINKYIIAGKDININK